MCQVHLIISGLGTYKIEDKRWVEALTIPPPCLLSLHILRPVRLLFPPQDTVNALSDFLGFFHFLFQCKIPQIECFPLGG